MFLVSWSPSLVALGFLCPSERVFLSRRWLSVSWFLGRLYWLYWFPSA